ncbi:alpha/beta hydrolase [Ktedonosporobacter rubrisoli]|uniref:Alpha/beta hydrolase n=1 Tax=Ktedonosporobacter rubrisoli TaxID=2509675 RepID=A0A4P6JUS1_KTERU|nr:alpha/beta hydrolase [Ktedonosporobacter rubrisoli]QBD79398.1 alpha/beta hydrolase [Ktedonosporobacter rubrisoli]
MQIGLKQLIEPGLKPLVNESQQFIEARKAAAQGKKQPDLTTPSGLQEAREARKPSGRLLDRQVVESIAEADGRKVPVRIIKPKQAKPRGVYLDIHGGGFYLESAARGDTQNAHLADALGATVVSVDYRLAPENPWPAAPDDCATAAFWLVKQAKSLFGTTRLLIGGASAGSTLTMTSLLRLRDNNLIAPFLGAVLQFGAYDLSGQTPGGRRYADEYFIQAYVGKVANKTQPDISPLYGDLKGLPPALMVVGTADILLEDTFAMAARLSAAGGEVDLRVYPEAVHGFTSHPTKMGAAARQDIINWLKERLDSSALV